MIGCSTILAPSNAHPPAAAPGVSGLEQPLLALLVALGLVLFAGGFVEEFDRVKIARLGRHVAERRVRDTDVGG